MGDNTGHARAPSSFLGAVLHWHVVLHATMFTGKRFSGSDRTCAECGNVFQKITPAGHNSSQCSVIQAWTGTSPGQQASEGASALCASFCLPAGWRTRGLAAALDSEGSYDRGLGTSGRRMNTTWN